MRFVQKLSRFSKTEFGFEDKQLEYVFDGETVKTAFTLPYINIGATKSIQSFRVCTITTIIGYSIFLSALITFIAILFLQRDSVEDMNRIGMLYFTVFIVGLAFVGFGVSCFGSIRRKRDATVIPVGLGNILVFQDDKHKAILGEIEKRRTSEIRRVYGKVDMLNHPELELRKFLQLKEQGIISNEEFVQARAEIYAEAKSPLMGY